MIRSSEIKFAKDIFSVECTGEVLYVRDGIMIGDSDIVESAVVSTWTPIT